MRRWDREWWRGGAVTQTGNLRRSGSPPPDSQSARTQLSHFSWINTNTNTLQSDQNLRRGPHVLRQQQLLNDICCRPAPELSSEPAAVDRWDRRTEERRDTRPFYDACGRVRCGELAEGYTPLVHSRVWNSSAFTNHSQSFQENFEGTINEGMIHQQMTQKGRLPF